MSDLINSSLNKLKSIKIPNPNLDLRIMLNHCSKLNKEIFFSNFNQSDVDIVKFEKILNRRLNNEPISKIVNKKSFWKFDFYVDKNVIDPRPETELIIEEALKIYKNKKKFFNILDIGTGSGCLSVCLAKEYQNSKITAIDISKKAMKVAKKNFELNNCSKQILALNSNIETVNNKFDLIVSNPPYLSKKDYELTSIDIKRYEPKKAFYGGEDGLYFYRKFSRILPKLMKTNSFLILEIGENQADKCINIINKSGLKFQKKVQDLQKKDRILIFSKLNLD